MDMVPSRLVVADRAVADDAGLLADVPVRRAHVPKLLVWMLQRCTQGRDIVTSETAPRGPTKFPSEGTQSRLLKPHDRWGRLGSFNVCSCLP